MTTLNNNHDERSNLPVYQSPQITTYTADQLLELMGPVHANNSDVGDSVMGLTDFTKPDPYSDPNQ